MCLELRSLCAGEGALFANKRLLSTVDQHVSFQFRSSDVCVAALVAAVRLRTIMMNHVHFEVFCHLERAITLKT